MSFCNPDAGRGQSETLLRIALHNEADLISARWRAARVAGHFGLDDQDRARLAAAVFELASAAFDRGPGAVVEFLCGLDPDALQAVISDRGFQRKNAHGASGARAADREDAGIAAARGLVDELDVAVSPDGARAVRIGVRLPSRLAPLTGARMAEVAREVVEQAPPSAIEETQHQNREMVRLLEDVRARQADIRRLNQELEETNRGVMALYAELDDRAQQLKEASETKSRFLSNMSHEFRTPLASIVSLATMLLDRTDGDLNAEQEKQTIFIRNSARDLIEMVNDLLDIAKIEAGRLVVAPAWFELIELFSALRGMFRPLLNSPNVSMIFEEPGNLPPMYSDQAKIAQILRNFISNALKFTEAGEIRVSARPGPDATIAFAVKDTGIGIPNELHEHIFEEFSQVENPIQRRVKGTGLGLPLCRKLAGLLHGSVSVESAPGLGSTFTLIVPQRLTLDAELPHE